MPRNNSKKNNNNLDDIDEDEHVPEVDEEEEWEDFDEEEEEGDWEDFDDDDDDEDLPPNSKNKSGGKKGEDLYAVLGLTKQATQEEIAKAYRRQALQFHPDRNPEGGEMFKKLTAAYEVLSDPSSRKRYDRTGEVDANGDVDIDEVSRSHEIQDMLEHFMNAFRYSEDEIEELEKAFVAGRGVLEATLDNFPWTNDEGELERIVQLVNDKIISNDNNRASSIAVDDKFKATWKKSATSSKVQSLTKKLDKERKEAEEILAEILNARNNDSSNNNNNQRKRKNSSSAMMITAGKNSSNNNLSRQPKNTSASSSSSTTRSSSAAAAAGSSSSNKAGSQLMLPSLTSLRENAKKNFFDNIADLEAKYGNAKNSGAGSSSSSSNKKAKKETKKK